MRLARLLPARLRRVAPEALAFGAIGGANTVLYLVIFNVAMGIGAVKATVVATIVTTTVSYLANRHWTYRDRPRSALRREYSLFFSFNIVGMLIQSGSTALGKYGFGWREGEDVLLLNVATCAGVGLATAFRFWAYRTLVFRREVDTVAPADRPAAGALRQRRSPGARANGPAPGVRVTGEPTGGKTRGGGSGASGAASNGTPASEGTPPTNGGASGKRSGRAPQPRTADFELVSTPAEVASRRRPPPAGCRKSS